MSTTRIVALTAAGIAATAFVMAYRYAIKREKTPWAAPLTHLFGAVAGVAGWCSMNLLPFLFLEENVEVNALWWQASGSGGVIVALILWVIPFVKRWVTDSELQREPEQKRYAAEAERDRQFREQLGDDEFRHRIRETQVEPDDRIVTTLEDAVQDHP